MTQEADSQNDKILIKMNSKQKFRSLKNSRDRSIKIGDKVFKDRYDDYGQDFIDQTRNISRKKLYLNGSQKKLSFDQQQIEEIRQTQIEEYTNNLFQLAPFNRKNLDQLIPDQQQSHRKSRASKKRYDGIDNEKSLNRDSSQKSSLQQYYNPTSPGDYNLPNLIGRETQSKSKAPAYSFGSKYSIKQVISSQHKQDLVGSDSPGVGYYKNSDKLIVEKSQRDHLNKSDLQFGTSPRFFEFQNQLMLKKKLPLQYEEEDQNSINKKTNQSQLKSILNDKDLVINQDKRMPYGLKDQKKFDSPGPGSYQTFQSSLPISKNGSQRSLEIVKSLRQQQERFEITKKTFHREWKTDQIGQESKGPGYYDFEIQNLKAVKAYKIPNQDRGLLKTNRNFSPSPASYETTYNQQIQTFKQGEIQQNNIMNSHSLYTDREHVLKPKIKGGLQAKAQRNIQIIKYQSQNTRLFQTNFNL